MNNFEKIDKSKLGNSDVAQSSVFTKFLEEQGFINLGKADIRSSNDIYFGEKDGVNVFFKKYRDRDADKAKKRAETEIACYENLPDDYLLKVIELNLNKGYLALEKADLEKVDLDEESVESIIDLYLNRITQINPSFLPEREYSWYLGLFEKIKNINSKNIISNGASIITEINNKKRLINEAPKLFSHGDYNLSNIKKDNNRLVVFDFEHAARDNAMVDMATLYIDLHNSSDL